MVIWDGKRNSSDVELLQSVLCRFNLLMACLLFVTEEVSLCQSDAVATLGLRALRLREYRSPVSGISSIRKHHVDVNVNLPCFTPTGVPHEPSEETAPWMGWESERWLSPYECRRSASAQCITDGLQRHTRMPRTGVSFCLCSFRLLIPLSLFPSCLVSVRLLLQSGGLSAHRWRSAAPAPEDWQCHPETPLWAGHHGPGKERSPLTPLPCSPTTSSFLLCPCSHRHISPMVA